jgi:hypothetical protein
MAQRHAAYGIGMAQRHAAYGIGMAQRHAAYGIGMAQRHVTPGGLLRGYRAVTVRERECNQRPTAGDREK